MRGRWAQSAWALGIAVAVCGWLVFPDWAGLLVPFGLLLAIGVGGADLRWGAVRPAFIELPEKPPQLLRWVVVAGLSAWLVVDLVNRAA